MSKTDHVASARKHLDNGDAEHALAVQDIKAARAEGVTWAAINQGLGRGRNYAERFVAGLETRAGAPFGGAQENERKDQVATRKVLREADPSTLQRIVGALPAEQQEAIGRVAIDAATARAPRVREDNPDAGLLDVVKADLTAQAGKLVAQAARIDVLLQEDAEFRRVDAAERDRLIEDLERVQQTAGRLADVLRQQTQIRRVA